MDAVVASYISIAAVYGTPAAYAVWKDTAYAAEAMASASSVAVGKAAVELAGLDPDDYADAAAVAASSTAMQAVAASSTAMQAVAASPVSLNAICKNSEARKKFNASSFRDANFSAILQSCQNVTYFNTVMNNANISSGNANQWYSYDAVNGNRSNNQGSSTACIVLISTLYWWGNYNQTAKTTDGEGTLWANNSYSSGQQVTVNKVAMGGFRYYGTHHNIYAFTPK